MEKAGDIKTLYEHVLIEVGALHKSSELSKLYDTHHNDKESHLLNLAHLFQAATETLQVPFLLTLTKLSLGFEADEVIKNEAHTDVDKARQLNALDKISVKLQHALVYDWPLVLDATKYQAAIKDTFPYRTFKVTTPPDAFCEFTKAEKNRLGGRMQHLRTPGEIAFFKARQQAMTVAEDIYKSLQRKALGIVEKPQKAQKLSQALEK